MSNILIISAVFPPEPVVSATLSRDLAEKLAADNHVVVLCPKPTRPAGFAFSETSIVTRYHVHRLNSYTCPSSNFVGRLIESISFGRHCVDYIKNHAAGINVVYMNSWPLFAQYLVVKCTRKFNIQCVVHVQDIYPESLITKLRVGKRLLYRLLLPIDRYILQKSAAVLAISDNMKAALLQKRAISSEKVTVVHNWQDETEFVEFHNQIPVENRPFTFMYLGNNGPLAGVDFLIKTFVGANLTGCRLVIAGSGSQTEMCKSLVNPNKVRNVEFIPVPNGEVPAIQAQADVMLLPVKRNGAMSSIPSKLPAYMFSAKPIIACVDSESDTARAIVDAMCGLLVEPENEIKLKEAMIYLSEMDKSSLTRLGNNGYNYAMKYFSKSENLERISSLIKSFLKY